MRKSLPPIPSCPALCRGQFQDRGIGHTMFHQPSAETSGFSGRASALTCEPAALQRRHLTARHEPAGPAGRRHRLGAGSGLRAAAQVSVPQGWHLILQTSVRWLQAMKVHDDRRVSANSCGAIVDEVHAPSPYIMCVATLGSSVRLFGFQPRCCIGAAGTMRARRWGIRWRTRS